MKIPLRFAVLSLLLASQGIAGAPRKGVSYKPTQDGGRACYIDGVFAYEMPQVPKGLWGTTYGVRGTPALEAGPLGAYDWREFLQSKGIRFGKGASATYYAAFGHLVVVNTREQQEILTQWVNSPASPASQPPTSAADDPSGVRPQ
jgi:hypothetical protein